MTDAGRVRSERVRGGTPPSTVLGHRSGGTTSPQRASGFPMPSSGAHQSRSPAPPLPLGPPTCYRRRFYRRTPSTLVPTPEVLTSGATDVPLSSGNCGVRFSRSWGTQALSPSGDPSVGSDGSGVPRTAHSVGECHRGRTLPDVGVYRSFGVGSATGEDSPRRLSLQSTTTPYMGSPSEGCPGGR